MAGGCRRRAESRKFKASARAGLGWVAGRVGAAVPRQAAGSCTANRVRRPRTRSRAERSPVAQNLGTGADMDIGGVETQCCTAGM